MRLRPIHRGLQSSEARLRRSFFSPLRNRKQGRESRRRLRCWLSAEPLEERRVLAALVGVDFDSTTASSPTNWTSLGTQNTPVTHSDLVDVNGVATTFDLTINETGIATATCGANQICGFAAAPSSLTLPVHDQSLGGIDGQIYTDADPIELTWSDLTPGTDYEVYVFGLEGFYDSIQQDVRITGAGSPVDFTQSFDQNSLFINGELGSNTRSLTSYAEIVTADSAGEITIDITPNGFTLDVSLGGIAIREATSDLSLTILADSISEAAGSAATTATVSRNTDTTNALVVSLQSSDDGEADVPTTVTIPAGQRTSAPFPIDAIDDLIVDGSQIVTITASAADHADGTDVIEVIDDELSVLTVEIAASVISEGDGPAATTATVTRTSDTASSLTVNLASSDSGEAVVPASVTIPAGQTTSLPFEVDAVDDTADDGTQLVTVTATAAGHLDGVGHIEIVDDDVESALSLALATPSISEGAGVAATTGSVTREVGLIINRVDRGLIADDAVNGFQVETNRVGGTFDTTILRENPLDAAVFHVADIDSTIDVLGMDGTGGVEISDETGYFSPVSDVAFFDVYFDLATIHTFTLNGQVVADALDGVASAAVELSGPGTLLSFSELANASENGGATGFSESGLLSPGTYRFIARAEVTSSAVDTLADADFDFDFQLEPAELVVSLASDDTSEATTGSTVTIAAGQSISPSFDVNAVDDSLIDGSQSVTVTASAISHIDGTDTLEVTDDEVGTITVSIVAAEISESDGASATTATVSRNSIPTNDLLVTLISDDPSEATVPVSVTIPAGQLTSPPFPIDAVEDLVADGTKTVAISGVATSHSSVSDAVDVTDNDIATLTVAIDAAEISENGGATTATVTRNTETDAPLEVTLVSSNTGAATVQNTVVIAAGQTTSPAFAINGVDNAVVDGTRTATINATSTGFVAGADSINVTDDDAPQLTVTILDASISEADGVSATTATVSRNDDTTHSLVVTLASGDASEVAVQTTVTIAAGQTTSLPFNLDAVDDIIVDGTQIVGITATSTTHAGDTATIEVTDDEVAGFTVSESDGYTLVFENGTSDTFRVQLDGQPTSDVVIDVSSSDTDEVTVSPSSLTFSESNWNVPQWVTVTGVDDNIVDGDVAINVTLSVNDGLSSDSFDNVVDQFVIVTNRDVDGAIRGRVWEDVDGNQIQNNGEVGLAGVTVYLDLDRSGGFDAGEPTRVTGPDGSYLFEELVAGEYVVSQLLPPGFAQSFPQVVGQVETFAEFIADVDPTNQASRLLTHATHAPGDVSRLFVLEKGVFDPGSGFSVPGRIRILDLTTGTLLPTPFLTITDTDGESEGGLTGMAFHPDFANNGKFYVYVSVDQGDPNSPFSSHVREYRVSPTDPDIADPASKREILRFSQPTTIHNGGWLGFGPGDGYLYITTGDGGDQHDSNQNAQALDQLLGKVLRVDVNADDFPNDPEQNYAIPPSNPMVNDPTARHEIWAYGLRNPWKASFTSSGDLFLGDVGQNSFEEINFQPAASMGGENYGWRLREGFQATPTGGVGGAPPSDNVDPILDYPHGTGLGEGISVVGGHVYEGPITEFQGLYLFADSGTHHIWAIDPNNPTLPLDTRRINGQLPADQNTVGDGLFGFDIVALSEDGSGNVYLIQIDGDIHKISKNIPGSHTVIVVAGETVEDVDFGVQDPQASSIGDFVWEDTNGNGIHETGELGLADVTVNLLDPDNGFAQVATTTSAAGGFYSFTGLPAGNYVVEFVTTTSLSLSPANQAGDDVDSDADPSTGRTGVITIGASTSVNSVDAGMFRNATVGDRVWADTNANGRQDGGEPGLAGVQVDLLGPADDFQNLTVQGWTTAPVNPNPPQVLLDGGPDGTDDAFLQFSSNGGGGAGGRLVLRNLDQWAGDLSNMLGIEASINNFGTTDLLMRIAVNGPGGWWATTNAAALPIAAGSGWSSMTFSLDPASLTNQFETESVNEGGTDLALTLSDVTELRILHNDQPSFRADPILAAAGIDNITPHLATTNTLADGSYEFSVRPGEYRVRFALPTDRHFSPVDQGPDDSIDSDAYRNGVSDAFTLGSGGANDTIDAGIYQLASIGDYVWDDVDGDGIQDPGEPGLGLVSVELFGQGDDFEDATLQGWTTAGPNPNPLQNLSNDGPQGAGDSFLQFSSNGGSGAGGRLIVRNLSQWTGDQRVVAIEADMNNFGSTDLLMRIAINGPGGWWVSTNASARPLPAGSGWTPVSFSMDPADFTNQFEAESENEGGTDLAATLSSVTELRLLHNDQPNFRADPILASAGLDNIIALVDATDTTADGRFQFSPRPGTYRLQYNTPLGRQISPADQGVDDALDSDADEFGRSALIAVSSGDVDESVDAGMVAPTLTVAIAADSISEIDGTMATTAIVSRNSDTTNPLVVTLTSSDTSEATVPVTITIPAGQSTSAPFGIDAVDDDIVDQLQTVLITASAPNHIVGTDSVGVTDDETSIAFVSFSTSGSVGDVAYEDEDILAYDSVTGEWLLYFDGSRVGLAGSDINAFHIQSDGSILLSFDGNTSISGLGLIRDSDIVKFTPASHGVLTAGGFEWFLNGSDVGLSPTSGDLDALAFTPDGRLVVSLPGSLNLPAVTARSEDLLVLNNAVFGENSSGDWALYLDGSDVGLSTNNLWGASIDQYNGEIHLTTQNGFSVSGVSGDAADIFTCSGTTGENSTCAFTSWLDGGSGGVASGQSFDGIQVGAFTGAEVFGQEVIYLSSANNLTIFGLSLRDEDILFHDTRSGAMRVFFDGSDVGVTSDVNAFHVLDDGSVLMSFNTSTTLAGIGTALPPDIVRFIPSSTGEETAGVFEVYLDGSDVELTTFYEDIDAITFDPNGNLLVSTTGGYTVGGITGTDSDLLRFTATSTGETSAGTWDLYFDGSDAGLTSTSSDLNAASISPASGLIHYSTLGNVNVGGVSGAGTDILTCDPGSIGEATSCTMSFLYHGAGSGITQILDGIHVIRPSELIGKDFGDAPSPYPTLLSADGAHHVAEGPTLGLQRDTELDASASPGADGDDVNGAPDDEDGVMFGTIEIGADMAGVNIELGNATTARVDAWIDFDGDGAWNSSEQILQDVAVVSGLQTLNFAIPTGATAGDTYARVRVSTAGGLAVTGLAADGEVEDHPVTILPPSAPRVQSVVLNDGEVQRSSLTSARVTFDKVVDIDDVAADPFQFTNLGTGDIVVDAPVISIDNGRTVVDFTFIAGDSVSASGTLHDGAYQLMVKASQVTFAGVSLDADGDGSGGDDFLFGDNAIDNFFRKYGDENGNNIVDLLDFARFRQTFGKTVNEPGYLDAFDSDDDESIGLLDFANFRQNFGT